MSSEVRRERRGSRPAQGPVEVPSGPAPGSPRGPQEQIPITQWQAREVCEVVYLPAGQPKVYLAWIRCP